MFIRTCTLRLARRRGKNTIFTFGVFAAPNHITPTACDPLKIDKTYHIQVYTAVSVL